MSIYMSTNSENLVEMSPVHYEILGFIRSKERELSNIEGRVG